NADVKNLLELVELYPYVSTFPILYLKALANSKDIRLESEIEKYAYRISSRAVLFDLLNERQELEQIATTEVEPILVQQDEVVQVESDLVPEPEVIVESDILEEVSQVEIVPESEATVLSEPEIVEEIVQFEEEIVPESEAIVLSEPEIIEEIVQVEPEIVSEIEPESKVLEETIHVIEKVESEAQIKEVVFEKEEVLLVPRFEVAKSILEETKTDEQELDKLIQSSALAANFVLISLEEEKSEEIIKQEVEEEISANEQNEPILKKEILKEISLEENSEKELDFKERSFSSWLHFGELKAPEIAQVTKEETPETIEEPKKTEYYNFDKPKKEFFSPSKKAKESVDENKMPVSETLAKIFALQGNYPKSIYVYEQLILIFPEKKSFFATQIKNLKKKLNS
ncbi:MAG: hypothetical protein EBS86_08125, partial [Crocinitomicaceae bacterium]|nr:hypothetical protein [Crocinitomicaceae bacterium]